MSGGSSRAKRAGDGVGWPSGPTGKPPPRSIVSNAPSLPRRSARVARLRRTASRQASTAPSWDPTWTWIPRATSPPPEPRVASIAAASSASVIPNFERPAPTARPGCVSGATSGFRRNRTSSDGRPPSPRPARFAILASTTDSSSDSTAIHRTGSPAAAARTTARRSASLLPTPSTVTRSFGMPARRASDHSPRETTLAPPAAACAAAEITAGTSFALTEYSRIQGSGNAARSRSPASSTATRSMTWTGVPAARAASRSAAAMSGRRSSSAGSALGSAGPVTRLEELPWRERDGRNRRHDADHDGPDDRPDDRVRIEVRWEAADLEAEVQLVRQERDDEQHRRVDDERDQAQRHHADRERERLHDRLQVAVHEREDQGDGAKLPPVVAEVEAQLGHDLDRDVQRDRVDDDPDDQLGHV